MKAAVKKKFSWRNEATIFETMLRKTCLLLLVLLPPLRLLPVTSSHIHHLASCYIIYHRKALAGAHLSEESNTGRSLTGSTFLLSDTGRVTYLTGRRCCRRRRPLIHTFSKLSIENLLPYQYLSASKRSNQGRRQLSRSSSRSLARRPRWLRDLSENVGQSDRN